MVWNGHAEAYLGMEDYQRVAEATERWHEGLKLVLVLLSRDWQSGERD